MPLRGWLNGEPTSSPVQARLPALAPSSPPAQESPVPGPSAAAPTNADTGENAPVPRDNIPD